MFPGGVFFESGQAHEAGVRLVSTEFRLCLYFGYFLVVHLLLLLLKLAVNLLLPLLLPAVNPVRLSLIGLFCGVVRSIWLRIIRVVRQELGSVIHALMTRSFGCRTDRRDGALE